MSKYQQGLLDSTIVSTTSHRERESEKDRLSSPDWAKRSTAVTQWAPSFVVRFFVRPKTHEGSWRTQGGLGLKHAHFNDSLPVPTEQPTYLI